MAFDCGFCCYVVTRVVIAYVIYKLIDHVIRIPRTKRMTTLLKRHVLVTGCDTGFGLEITKRLDRLGCWVFAGCYSQAGEEFLKKFCSPKVMTFRLDVTKAQSVKDAYDFVKKNLPEGKGLYGIVNNAGVVGSFGPTEWLSVQDYKEAIQVNLFGTIDVTTTFLPLVKQERGRIVNMASVGGRTTFPGGVPYSMSKYGVECFSDALRRQLRPYKCTVHLVEPGFFKTNITSPQTLNRRLDASWEKLSPELKQEFGREYYEKTSSVLITDFIESIASERISDVVDAYEHALLGIFPRARYVLGMDAKLFWLPVQWLPEWLGDKLFEIAAPSRPIPAACKK